MDFTMSITVNETTNKRSQDEAMRPTKRKLPVKKPEAPKPVFISSDVPHKHEDISEYRPGGFHPVHIGNGFHPKGFQFRIANKLGRGGMSTVWLAKEINTNRFISLKICAATQNNSHREDEMAERISERVKFSLKRRSGKEKLRGFAFAGERKEGMISDFQFKGPNGSHSVLVSEVYGPTLWDVINGASKNGFDFGPKWHRSVARNTARALAFLHNESIAHGDYHTRNILFQLPDFHSWSDIEIAERFPLQPRCCFQLTKEEQPRSKSHPRYMTSAPPLMHLVNHITDEVVVIDFGSSSLHDSPPPTDTEAFSDILAPENLIGARLTPASDIWALACTIFEIRTASILFQDQTNRDDIRQSRLNILQDVIACLGPLELDTEIFEEGNGTDDHFVKRIVMIGLSQKEMAVLRGDEPWLVSRVGELRDLIQNWPPCLLSSQSPSEQIGPLRPWAGEKKLISVLEAACFYHLLRQMLRFEPKKRILCEEVVKHMWFSVNFEEEELRRLEKGKIY